MKRIQLIATALLALGVALLSNGCANLMRRQPAAWSAPRPQTYALVVSVNGNEAPTDVQWASLQKKFSAMLAAKDLTLLIDPTFADKLIHVQFYPDADDPTTGTVYVVGVRNNTSQGITTLTRTAPVSTSYSYSGSSGFGANSYFPQYYGYYDDYTYGSSYGGNTVTVTTPPKHVDHPGQHHTTRPIDCPPEAPGRPPGGYAGNHPPGEGWRGRPSSQSDSTSYSSNSSYSSSRPVYDSPSYSSSSYSSSSSSSPVYSSPSPSYSSSSNSAPSISMSSSSSSSYSAPSISMSSSSSDTSSSSSSSSSSSGGGSSSSSTQPR